MEKRELIGRIIQALDDGKTLIIFDPNIFMGNWGGWTKLWADEPGAYRVFSFGRGWEDQYPSSLDRDQVARYLWKIPIRYLREASREAAF
ncbi:MAG: hypothetical protein DRN81_04535 [Thermoproteota archaeon]|nr:MAG: hypothetical protein DRN81_04535 [Candidatus Korarchaeota archaeon]